MHIGGRELCTFRRVANPCVNFQAGKVSGAWQDFRANRGKVIEQTGFRDCAPVMWGAGMSQNHPLQDKRGDSCLSPRHLGEGKMKNSGKSGLHEPSSQKTKAVAPLSFVLSVFGHT